MALVRDIQQELFSCRATEELATVRYSLERCTK